VTRILVRLAKGLGLTLAVVLTLVLIFVAFAWISTSRRLGREFAVAAEPLEVPRDAAAVDRGRHVAIAIAKCGLCHGDDLGGRVMEDAAIFARLSPPNVTSGRGGVTAGYAPADWERAIRHGLRRDGRPLQFMPAEAFQAMGDEDLGALIAYLESVPPVDREVPPTRMGPMARVVSTIGNFPLAPAEWVDHDAPHAARTPDDTLARGEYLATVGGCRSCHGPGMAGNGAPGAPDITRGRLAAWTEADFTRALRAGVRPDGTPIAQTMPWIYAGKMTDGEIHAVWTYVRSVPPAAVAGD
jgi:mono/diheme cytochrome c family protein